ncbi:2,3-dehydroadipyl-CoA hydratase [Thalassovita gelatinovora]|uniref:2,3-dehydroadipyl-CoA hydratase n=1 Tax=Thalassovita gelatinovora TaxID=53501 RepID=A0A0P1G760_THAGE|nr:enoyl-CoA hydratase/isomerase family protein [Thalassovita gelatinovora]QIZ81681.1 enoyl-CoA hydratase/isomerase family protein [Thalassovita gelatinovora]CUH68208.1 2,3-dehydroadipyl-CoA hydratase [Thalassovita gelatinovora]SEQ31217.1 Enoyl-CoA hydratase/carnithine racemase [Thalassovita gelatinovora]
MTEQFVSIERAETSHGQRIAIVRFDTGSKANALSQELMRQLITAARSFEGDADTNAIILTGRADRFCLGMDLKDPEFQTALDLPLNERRQLLQLGPRMCKAWEDLEPMTICAIEGWCVGGGVALAASLDLRVCGHSSQFYIPEIERGLNMGWGSLPRIAALIGPARAKRLAIVAEQINAQTAESWGWIDYLTEDGNTMTKALSVAEQIAAMPPVAVRMIKQGIETATKPLHHAVSAMDMDQFALMQCSADHAEGVASFLEQRDAKFTGG